MHNQTDRTNLPEHDGTSGREQAALRVGSGGNARSGASPDVSTFDQFVTSLQGDGTAKLHLFFC